MSSADQDNVAIVRNGHAPQENGQGSGSSAATETTPASLSDATNGQSSSSSNTDQLQILGHIKSIEQINEKRRLFLKSTIKEIQEEGGNEAEVESEPEPQLRKQPPPNTLPLSVKYATLPSPSVAASSQLRSPLSPPPKPPMLSRTRSTGSGDGRSPLSNGEFTLLRHSITEATVGAAAAAAEAAAPPTAATAATPAAAPIAPVASTATTGASSMSSIGSGEQTSPPATISAKHYESLIEELRCPGCANPMKAPVLLCKSGHSICEQCTRILLMCPLCKEGFSNSRSLTIEALCAKAHFGCSNASGGCVVRMPVALLPWHEQQCIYKPMKCFMGRVWGECKWHGREVQWKQHLEQEHTDKLFRGESADLVWDMGERRKPLTGYYVFQAHDEMFNFYEIYDKQRIMFTMTCTSNRRESKYNYAYEVTLLQPDNEALSLTQKFPVHSEYDKDILLDGTCVTVSLTELARFIDDDKILHYRVSVMAVKSPRRVKPSRQSMPLPLDYQQMKPAGNGKSVAPYMIITRTYKEAIGEVTASSSTAATPDSEEDNTGGIELERKWGTPQLHFNRKYLRNALNDDPTNDDEKKDQLRPLHETRSAAVNNEDKLSLCSNSTSYTRKMSDTLRRSFRTLKTDLIEMRPFSKKKSTPKSPLTSKAAPSAKSEVTASTASSADH